MPFPLVALFDLDGTLLDSAPDMLAAVNAMRAGRDTGPMTLAQLRPQVSKGARAMLAAGFPDWDADERERHVPAFLEAYERELGRHGGPFAGVEAMLARLEGAGCRWGIVTNKPEYLARQLMPGLGWESRSAVLIGGDTLSVRKPDPLPLQVAAERMGVDPGQCAYVGDDERDIVAARAAGMASVVALWGYRLADDDPIAWRGDAMVDRPLDLCEADAWPVAR
ncbi:phosphoglycolate phosphatase [Lysobacter sp. A3-1-A15]|uniref:phosphoglycolate phosphatase n=1 Tax=Novilysobacter viscosus TaxID=3098602 RepID=UPI002ED8A22D